MFLECNSSWILSILSIVCFKWFKFLAANLPRWEARHVCAARFAVQRRGQPEYFRGLVVIAPPKCASAISATARASSDGVGKQLPRPGLGRFFAAGIRLRIRGGYALGFAGKAEFKELPREPQLLLRSRFGLLTLLFFSSARPF
jgi:hypothetical protein